MATNDSKETKCKEQRCQSKLKRDIELPRYIFLYFNHPLVLCCLESYFKSTDLPYPWAYDQLVLTF